MRAQLDADDGEMTRTRKVRRRIVEEKFDDLIGALYDGKDEIYTTTEVTYEDGTTKTIECLCRVDTVDELDYIKAGGILHYVLRNLVNS